MMKPLVAMVLLACSTFDAAAQSTRQNASEPSRVRIETVASGLVHPWGMALLPDGRMLMTERPGRLRVVGRDGALSEPIAGLPRIYARGQGGLLDLVTAPDFEKSRTVYFSFSEPGPDGTAGTAVARARLDESATRLEDVTVIFRQEPKVQGDGHFGSRLAFARDGTLFVTLGERFKFAPAQDITQHLGTLVRINADGTIPKDNPFVGRTDARPEIWSYGHRNIQAAAVHPETGALWIAEMGPKGGDELNRVVAGGNYGWPLVSSGTHYDGRAIPDPSTRPEFVAAVYQWTPVIAPSGMAIYTGDAFPAWRGSMLIGGLRARAIVRVTLDDDGKTATEAERIDLGARVRDVAQGPDGNVYAITDDPNGRLLRVTPR